MPENLPLWDMTPVFPSLESAEFQTDFRGALAAIDELEAQFERFGVRRRENPLVDDALRAQFEEILGSLNALEARLETLGAYIGCFVTTDAKNEVAQALGSSWKRAASCWNNCKRV
jgi:oligoendopeptidase F